MIDETQLARFGPPAIPDASGVTSFRITADYELEAAIRFAEILQAEIKGFEAGQEEVVTPTFRAYKKGLKWFTDRINPRKEARNHIRAEIERYLAEKRANVQAALVAATTHEEVREAVAAVAAAPEGMSESDDWRFEIDDPLLLPREWLIPNQAALDAAAEKYKNATAIPGGRAVCRKVPILNGRGKKKAK